MFSRKITRTFLLVTFMTAAGMAQPAFGASSNAPEQSAAVSGTHQPYWLDGWIGWATGYLGEVTSAFYRRNP